MDSKLELVLIPVSDVDRAKAFYTENVGFDLDVDTSPTEGFRVVQMTPPGSACSITIGTGLTDSRPGSYRGTHLIVTDIEAARAELVGRGVEVSDLRHFDRERGEWQPGADPSHADYGSFADFSDPDGNTWVLQEVGHGKPESLTVTIANRSVPAATVIPVLAYPDVVEATGWLCTAFGFRVRLHIGDHRAQLVYGDGAVIVTQGGGEPAGHSVHVRVEDADAHHEQAAAAGATIVSPPTDYPYGERQYTAEDPAGHHWTFSQSVGDVDPADWGGVLVVLEAE